MSFHSFGKVIGVFAVIAFSAQISCASQSAKKSPPPTTTTTGEDDKTLAPDKKMALSCSPTDTTAPANAASWTGEVQDGKTLTLNNSTDTQALTTCDALSTQGKKVGIFQFTGVLCIECHDVSIKVQNYVDQKGGQVVHFLVFTDAKDQRTMEQVNTFVTSYSAGKAIPLFDIDRALWKKIAHVDNPINGTTFIINNMGHFVSIPDSNGMDGLLSQVDALVKSAK